MTDAPNKPHKAWYHRGYLPHFDAGAVVQLVTFRLADSIPRVLMESVGYIDDPKRRVRIESVIDEGRGACLLREEKSASVVRDALQHFDGKRYRLISWVIMPNHVHAMVEQIEGHRLADIVDSWKSFTAKKINSQRGSRGAVWAADYFDRFVRGERHYQNAISYIENNPVKARLATNPQDWPYSSASDFSHRVLSN